MSFLATPLKFGPSDQWHSKGQKISSVSLLSLWYDELGTEAVVE